MYEERASASAAARLVWRAVADRAGRYPTEASEYWGISFVRGADGAVRAELNGPRLEARIVESDAGDEYWGVELRAHVVIRGADKRAIAGATVPLDVRGGTVSVGGSAVPVPAFDELEHFVDALLRDGALIADEEVWRALGGMVSGWSARTWQRRIARVTGMTRGQLERTERARAAYHLLQQGVPPAEAAHRAGFADQPHLTREMRRFAGQTPARILAGELPG